MVGDVATVSDAQLHADNPFEALTLEIDRLARKHRLQPHHFREDVRGGPAGDWPKQKMVLHLPPRAELVAFLKARVEPFIRQVKAAPHEPARINVKDARVDFTISYDPARQTGGAGHTSYDRALSLTENPIYTALENKRRRGQLRGAPEAALRMIVLCDAGCASMRDQMNAGTTHDADAIAMRFLQSTSSIDLVVLMTVERTAPYAVRSDLRLKITPIGSPQAVAAGCLPKAVIDAVNHFLRTLCAHMPHPVQDASNAYRQFDQPGYGLGAHGGYTVSPNRIRVSSRELLEHLVLWQCKDRIPVDRAREAVSGTAMTALQEGRLIKSVEVIDGGDIDDDYVEIRFTDPDPAISPFVGRKS